MPAQPSRSSRFARSPAGSLDRSVKGSSPCKAPWRGLAVGGGATEGGGAAEGSWAAALPPVAAAGRLSGGLTGEAPPWLPAGCASAAAPGAAAADSSGSRLASWAISAGEACCSTRSSRPGEGGACCACWGGCTAASGSFLSSAGCGAATGPPAASAAGAAAGAAAAGAASGCDWGACCAGSG